VDAIDIIDIHQLLGEYGHAIDGRDWDGFAALFADDATMDYTLAGAPDVYNGIAEILGFFKTANHPSAHHVTNIVVTNDDGIVRVHSKFIAPYTRPAHSPHRWRGGDYHDIVFQSAGRWRFRSKVCVGTWQYTPELPGQDVADQRRSY
jgi:3-phenylpropionate/cinnamic acid dioxygenase small subunit